MSSLTEFSPRLNIQAMLRKLLDDRVAFFTNSGVPVDGSSGSFAAYAGIGSLLVNVLTGVWYTNVGTLAAPVWQNMVSPVTASGGLGVIGNAKMTYDFTVDGGVQGEVIPSNSPTLPIGSIILGGTIDITSALTSGGSATISLGTTAGSTATSIKGATAVATWSLGQLAMVPVFTAATYLKLTAAGRLNMTINVADLLTGKFDVNLVYLRGN